MNKFKSQFGLAVKITLVTALLGCFIGSKTEAASYGVANTFWTFTASAGGTNIPGTATNLASAVNCTYYDEFVLSVQCGLTNPSVGTLDIRWSKGMDGVNFCTIPNCPPSSGWFSVPLTNGGTNFVWTTNIVVDSIGHWRLDWLTNNCTGAHATNFLIEAYQKPIRSRPF